MPKTKDELQHQADVDAGFKHDKSPDAGACITKHEGDWRANVGCSYRWQSYRKMQSHKSLYDYPAYKKLCESTTSIPTAQFPVRKTPKNPEGVWPTWYWGSHKPPKPGDWDVKGNNFQKKCYHPYWHEAHHIVPGSVLRNSFVDYARQTIDPGAMVRVLRRGLLDEPYNLNHLVNMITLPLDHEIGKALKLPVHRKTAQLRDHQTYSRYVKDQLMQALHITFENYDGHDIPEYQPLKQQIVSLSNTLYADIILCESLSLDDMETEDFDNFSS